MSAYRPKWRKIWRNSWKLMYMLPRIEMLYLQVKEEIKEMPKTEAMIELETALKDLRNMLT